MPHYRINIKLEKQPIKEYIIEDGFLNLSIADNGVGFDKLKKDNGIGLRNIRSREEFYSGNMNIISSPGKGCRLEVTIPM